MGQVQYGIVALSSKSARLSRSHNLCTDQKQYISYLMHTILRCFLSYGDVTFLPDPFEYVYIHWSCFEWYHTATKNGKILGGYYKYTVVFCPTTAVDITVCDVVTILAWEEKLTNKLESQQWPCSGSLRNKLYISIANALEILQSCTDPWICHELLIWSGRNAEGMYWIASKSYHWK